MQPDKIKTHKDFQRHGLDIFVHSVRGKRGWAGQPSGVILPSPAVKAEINHGRWIARCPFCTGAELVDLEDPRFYCLSCDMEAVGGKWLQVILPGKNREQIEAELLKRSLENRNWLPGETMAKLRKENQENGVVV